MKMINKRLVTLAAFPLFAVALVTMGSPAQASGGGGGVAAGGTCSAGSTWALKAKPDDGQIDVEFEVDSNVAGQVWNVKLTDNGTKIFKGQRTTQGASSSFTVELQTPNMAGKDKFVGKATNKATGETCTGKVTL